MISATLSPSAKGSLSIFLCTATWGLFWMSLHYFDENGLVALRTMVGINIAVSLIAVPVALVRGEFKRENLKWLFILGLGIGISNVLYFAGISSIPLVSWFGGCLILCAILVDFWANKDD